MENRRPSDSRAGNRQTGRTPPRIGWVLLAVAVLAAAVVAAFVYRAVPGLRDAARGLKEGTQYYVYVDYVEVEPTRPDGDPWDVDASGPDVVYSVTWQSNQVFESSKRSDTLVAEWKAREMGMGFGNEHFIKGESSALAARITARPGTLTFHVWDADLVDGDDIGTLEVPISDLTEGRNEFSEIQAISRIVIMAQPIPPIEQR